MDVAHGTCTAYSQGWSWHECHQHWHYDNYAHYALRGLCSSGDVAWEDRPVVGHKNGWCAARPLLHPRHTLALPHKYGFTAWCHAAHSPVPYILLLR